MTNEKYRNCYEILDISPMAGDMEIKAAYRRMVMKYHPDRNPRNKSAAERRIRLLNEAYARINTAKKRKEYNHLLRSRIKPVVANDNAGKSLWGNVKTYVKEIFWPISDNTNLGA